MGMVAAGHNQPIKPRHYNKVIIESVGVYCSAYSGKRGSQKHADIQSPSQGPMFLTTTTKMSFLSQRYWHQPVGSVFGSDKLFN
jgi:hypothetical protein